MCDGIRRCDTYFIFCLRPTDSTDILGCFYYTNRTTRVFFNTASIDFAQNIGPDLRNPFSLPGLLEAYTVSVMTC